MHSSTPHTPIAAPANNKRTNSPALSIHPPQHSHPLTNPESIPATQTNDSPVYSHPISKISTAASLTHSIDSSSPATPTPTFTHSTKKKFPNRDVLDQKNELGPRLVIFMVGLPARGKSYICKKLSRYLVWCGFNTRIFNVGNRRRVVKLAQEGLSAAKHSQNNNSEINSLNKLDISQSGSSPPSSCNSSPVMNMSSPLGALVKSESQFTLHDAQFFNPHNSEARAYRDHLAMEVLEDALIWLKSGGKVAVHDATNSTKQRRQLLLDRISKDRNVRCIFVESICTDSELLTQNIQMKLQGPDYKKMEPEKALRDFLARTKNYEKTYQTIDEEEEKEGLSFIKIINVGRKVIAHNIKGYLPSHCVLYLMQMHLKERTIWLTRHGESEYNTTGQLGGDPPLTQSGHLYGKAMSKFIKSFHPLNSQLPSVTSESSIRSAQDDNFGTAATGDLSVWTSTLQRAVETGEYFESDFYDLKYIRTLNEIHGGICENMTYKEIQEKYPEEYQERVHNKLGYRYLGPGGESYLDVIERLRPLIIELERMETSVAVITHNAVLRTILAYFTGIPLGEMPNIEIPLHTLYRIQPKPYGADLVRYQYNEEFDRFDELIN